MTKKPKEERVQRSRADVEEALREQVSLLLFYCEGYDKGERALAKPMATTLRLLNHKTATSLPLLEPLGLRSGHFYRVAPKKVDNKNPASECGLISAYVSDVPGHRKAEYVAKTPPLALKDRLPYADWWNGPVLRSSDGITMSRRDIVTAVANTDGGAHVDAGVTKLYEAFRTGDLMGWHFSNGGLVIPFVIGNPSSPGTVQLPGTQIDSPQYACLRSITHEFQKYAPESFTRQYEFSTMRGFRPVSLVPTP
jgi:hypothetical protein